MKFLTLLLSLGIKKPPDYSSTFTAQNPFTGTFFRITFADGKMGVVCDNRNGKYIPLGKLIPKDEKRTFVTLRSAVDALCRGIVEYPDKIH